MPKRSSADIQAVSAMEVSLKTENLTEATQAVLALPGIFTRARRSAMSSTGWMIMTELRNHIEYGGTGWAPVHPLTLRFRKYRAAPQTPLYFMGRFARYLVDAEGFQAAIGLGKSKSGQPGQVDDPWLMDALKRHEEGQNVPVTRAMRRLWLTTKTKATRTGALGTDWFALRPFTTQIRIPPRPIMGPVFKKVEGKIPQYFQIQFHGAIERYRTGEAKK